MIFSYASENSEGVSPIWVDAICINQGEKDEATKREKYRQLDLMGQIYELAERVLVWLGKSKHTHFKSHIHFDTEYTHFRSQYDATRALQDRIDGLLFLSRREANGSGDRYAAFAACSQSS